MTYLIDVSGKVISNASSLESGGAVWSSDGSEIVTGYNAAAEMASTVDTKDVSVFIGD